MMKATKVADYHGFFLLGGKSWGRIEHKMLFKKGDKPINGAGKGNTRVVKHSLHVYRRMLSGKLDERLSLAKVLREKERELIDAMGGDPSPQQMIPITDVVDSSLFKGTIEKYLISIDGRIVRGTKVISVVDTWIALSKHIRGHFADTGP